MRKQPTFEGIGAESSEDKGLLDNLVKSDYCQRS